MLPELRLHYRTLGTPRKDASGIVRNAVLIMHGTGGTGAQFLGANFAGELFGRGQPLDVEQYFVILPDDIGHGKSSKPSDGLRAQFPRYGYADMVEAEYRLVTEGLGVSHLRLVMGTSMGGMHTWMWASRYPDFCRCLDAAGQRARADVRPEPGVAASRDRRDPPRSRVAGRRVHDPAAEPAHRGADAVAGRQQSGAPPARSADPRRRRPGARRLRRQLRQGQRRQRHPVCARVVGRLRSRRPASRRSPRRSLAINSADDIINPPELQILEREIKRVPKGRAVMLPLSDRTAGHGTHTLAAVWKQYLVELLEQTKR